MKSTNFAAVKAVLDALFNKFGFPQAGKSDNGPPFNGEDYKNYCKTKGIRAIFSTPLNPQQNGMVERYMQIVNKAMAIANVGNTSYLVELAQAIRAHNSAAHRVTQLVPDELMFGRKLRRSLPLIGDAKVTIDVEKLRKNDEHQKKNAAASEDKKRMAKETKLAVGDTVVVLNTTRAKGDPKFDPTPYIIKEKKGGDFMLEASDGRTLKRNVTHLKKLFREMGAAAQEVESVLNQDHPEAPGGSETDLVMLPPQQKSKRTAKTTRTDEPRRSTRASNPLKHFDMYIRLLEGNKVN